MTERLLKSFQQAEALGPLTEAERAWLFAGQHDITRYSSEQAAAFYDGLDTLKRILPGNIGPGDISKG